MQNLGVASWGVLWLTSGFSAYIFFNNHVKTILLTGNLNMELATNAFTVAINGLVSWTSFRVESILKLHGSFACSAGPHNCRHVITWKPTVSRNGQTKIYIYILWFNDQSLKRAGVCWWYNHCYSDPLTAENRTFHGRIKQAPALRKSLVSCIVFGGVTKSI